jgi:hypothetical protein
VSVIDEAIVDDTREPRAVAKLAARIVERVPTEGAARSELRRALTSGETRHRFEEALDRAVADGLVVVVGGRVERAREALMAERQEERTAVRALKDAKARLAEADKVIERLERELGVASRIGQTSTPPKWLTSPKKSKVHRGTPWLVLSDLHLDEVVTPAEVLGANAYNRSIAELRLQRTFEGAVKITRDWWSGITYDGIVVPMIGDIFSGGIHEELKETNEDTILGSLDHWIDHIAAGLSFLADEFGKVHVPTVVGNHGRMTRKPRAKQRARDNLDWFLGKALARVFAQDARVTFDVSEGADLIVPSYDQKVMLTHGDQVSGGAGIGGIWPPIMRLDARKSKRQQVVGQPYDLMLLGHWHTLTWGQTFVVNGSLKGIDEFSWQGNFGAEDPAQALFLMTPERGRTFLAAVEPMKRELEGW